MAEKKMNTADDLIKKARYYATQAHKRINHRRKYTNQPYDIHLKTVAELVNTVSDDPEMIAAAWLHDTVEDTPVTFHDIEKAFGPGIMQLVSDLTDVSKTSDGLVFGYVLSADLGEGKLEKCLRQFRKGQVLDGDASLSEVIHVLTLHNHCFVSLLGSVAGIITRSDIQKPIVRMWLFGIISLIEMNFVEKIRVKWPAESWINLITKARLKKAEELLEERRRRKQHCDLLDCLQFSDKARIIIEDPEQLEELGFKSKKIAKRLSKELESLRNNLAHSQDIVTHDWPQIARLAKRFEKIISR